VSITPHPALSHKGRGSDVVGKLVVYLTSPIEEEAQKTLMSLLHKAQKPCNRLWFKPQLHPSRKCAEKPSETGFPVQLPTRSREPGDVVLRFSKVETANLPLGMFHPLPEGSLGWEHRMLAVICLQPGMAARASLSARSFSGWPACPASQWKWTL